MPNIIASDYQVLRDSSFQLNDGEEKQFTFHTQNAIHYSSALRNHGVMSFNIRPVNSARLTVRAIGLGPVTIMNRFKFSKSHTRMYQEAFDFDAIVAATLDPGNPNNFDIEFRAEDGPIILSDIVLHYKILVPVT